MGKRLSKWIGLESDCFGINREGERVLEKARKVNVLIKRSNGFTTNECALYNSRNHRCNAEKDPGKRGFCYLQEERIGVQVSSAKVADCLGRDEYDKAALENPEQVIVVKFIKGLRIPLCRLYQNGTGECKAIKDRYGDCYNVAEGDFR